MGCIRKGNPMVAIGLATIESPERFTCRLMCGRYELKFLLSSS